MHPRETETVWSWITRAAVIVSVMLLFGGFAVMFLPRIREQQRAEAHLISLKHEEREKQLRRDQLEKRKAYTEDSAEYVETIGRDRLEMKRSGEAIFRFENPTAAN
jgi:cell division protein FtsB